MARYMQWLCFLVCAQAARVAVKDAVKNEVKGATSETKFKKTDPCIERGAAGECLRTAKFKNKDPCITVGAGGDWAYPMCSSATRDRMGRSKSCTCKGGTTLAGKHLKDKVISCSVFNEEPEWFLSRPSHLAQRCEWMQLPIPEEKASNMPSCDACNSDHKDPLGRALRCACDDGLKDVRGRPYTCGVQCPLSQGQYYQPAKKAAQPIQGNGHYEKTPAGDCPTIWVKDWNFPNGHRIENPECAYYWVENEVDTRSDARKKQSAEEWAEGDRNYKEGERCRVADPLSDDWEMGYNKKALVNVRGEKLETVGDMVYVHLPKPKSEWDAIATFHEKLRAVHRERSVTKNEAWSHWERMVKMNRKTNGGFGEFRNPNVPEGCMGAEPKWEETVRYHLWAEQYYKDLNKKEQMQELHPGCNVRLHSLKGAAALNGLVAVVEHFVEKTGRWRVKLVNGDVKDLKPDNLEVLEQDDFSLMGTAHQSGMVKWG